MGQEVCRAVSEASDLELVAAVDPWSDGPSGDASEEWGVDVAQDLGALEAADAHVAVDFTSTEAARTNMDWCAEHGVHAVVGTSGLTPADLERAEERFRGSGANVIVVPNFAIGAVLLMRFAELAAPLMDGMEIIELHHDNKRDAPSGTAMATAERMAEARRRAGSAPLGPDPTELWLLEGARGGDGPGGVRVHSVRLPGLVAHQEVVFGAAGQSLRIRHDSYDRRSFMPGVLLAVRSVPDRPGLTMGLEPLLGL
jgi:4-hydroxy-tetrahydrodipicolinate reductase